MPEIHAVIRKYLTARYKDGARGEGGLYDCWGLVRAARHELYGLPLLPAFGGEYRFDPAGFSECYKTQSAVMQSVDVPQPGTIAAVLRGKICMHVALVVKTGPGLQILEINPSVGVRIVPLHRFVSEHTTPRHIKYYDDPRIPQPT